MRKQLIQGLEPNEWEATLIRIEDYLVTLARESDSVVDYSTLWKKTGQRPSWHRFQNALAELGNREHNARRPPILALVVRRDSRLPVASAWEFLPVADEGASRRDVHQAALSSVRDFWRSELGDARVRDRA